MSSSLLQKSIKNCNSTKTPTRVSPTTNLNPTTEPKDSLSGFFKKYFKMKDSKVFTLQAFFVWAVICLPGNIVTLIMHNRIQKREAVLASFPPRDMNVLGSPKEVASELCLNGDFFFLFNERTLESALAKGCFGILQPYLRDAQRSCSSRENVTAKAEICVFASLHRLPHLLDAFEKKTVRKRDKRENYTCHEPLDEFGVVRSRVKFWLEGIGIVISGIFGLCGNFLTCIILRDGETNMNFNKLLIALAVADNCMIIDLILEKSIVGCFLSDEPIWYRHSYPHFFYPIKGIIQTTTIFLVVAVSAERYRAVCHPMTQRQAAYKFVITVVFIAVTLKIPRFFHFEIVDNNTDYWTTKLMEDPSYIRFSSYWDDLISTGFIPLMALVYFNLRIYLKIRASAKFECRFLGGSARMARISENITSVTTCNDEALISEDNSKKAGDSRNFLNASKRARRGTCEGKLGLPHRQRSSFTHLRGIPQRDEYEEASTSFIGRARNMSSYSNQRKSIRGNYREVDHFRKRREKSTLILVAIVIIFIVCHSYRLALKVYEVANPDAHTMEHFKYCHTLGRHHVPVASYILHNVHYVFLVLNSSVNFIIYCCVGQEFRNKMMRLFRIL